MNSWKYKLTFMLIMAFPRERLICVQVLRKFVFPTVTSYYLSSLKLCTITRENCKNQSRLSIPLYQGALKTSSHWSQLSSLFFIIMCHCSILLVELFVSESQKLLITSPWNYQFLIPWEPKAPDTQRPKCCHHHTSQVPCSCPKIQEPESCPSAWSERGQKILCFLRSKSSGSVISCDL